MLWRIREYSAYVSKNEPRVWLEVDSSQGFMSEIVAKIDENYGGQSARNASTSGRRAQSPFLVLPHDLAREFQSVREEREQR